MMKKLPVILLLVMFIASINMDVYASDLEDKYFGDSNVKLTQKERKAMEVAERWEAGKGNGGEQPFSGENGAIKFVFGTEYHTVLCAVLKITDIQLQPGEKANSIQLGDTARWNVEVQSSGIGAGSIEHVLIKPMDVGLQTNLVILTDRRTYHIRLRSERSQYMPIVAFSYPADSLIQWNKIREQERKYRKDNTIPETGEYLGDLSFDYTISGNAPWKPVRVFNDGHKTIIQMPRAMKQTESPVLLVVRKDGSLFSAPDTVMVNYRVQNDRYIVDTLFHKAILVSGVGGNQDKITIVKGDGK